ncbi:MAG TPA: type I polyketide synthase [Thermoanaerobaculia bacterium]|nr:type I polyketide synthase [Thermoanaerobaculia bacterium]
MSPSDDHGALLKKALREIKSLRSGLAEAKRANREPIAIVGMGCRFPGRANDPAAFWELLRSGTDAITEVPRSRWDVDALYDADPDAAGKMYTRHGGFLDGMDGDIDQFDAEFFGISPLDAMNMDPQQRLLLEVAWEVFENAGIVPDKAPRTGVYVGSFMDDYLQSNFFAADRNDIDAYNTLGLLRGLAAGRLAYVLNLQGPAMQLDTACSSSLLTAHLACQALRNRECDLALAGGVNLILAPEVTIGLCRMRAMAADGRCKSFDASADGYVRGEGCGLVVLKRLSEAVADGNRIYAVIRGSAVNHDGRSNGLTAPNGTAQKTLIREALDAAGVSPKQIQYLEAHGTGTSLGDPIEAMAVGEVLCRERTEPLLLGSVKSNVGHLESAAGVAALMKTALALHHGAIPPSLHFRDPNPHIPWDRLAVTVPTALTAWPKGESRFAGVSSFGMSGTNVHMILEQAPAAAAPLDREAPHVLTLSAPNEAALEALANNYVPFLEGNASSLRDICDSSNRGRKHFDHRLAIAAESAESLVAGLRRPHASSKRRKRPRIAFLFPGQGVPLAGDTAGSIQAKLFTYEVELARQWIACGIRPDAVIGHSVGEYAAACIAGVFSFDDGLKLIAERERLMNALPERGAMAAIFADEDRARDAIGALDVSIAALNGSHVVISGRAADVRAVAERFEARMLDVANAFHSSLMDPMLDEFEAAVGRATLRRPSLQFISAVTGAAADAELTNAAYWRQHVRHPVRFADCIRNVSADVFIEIGPKPTLISMTRHVLDRDDVVMLAGLAAESLATLYERGLDIDWSAVSPKAATVTLPSYPFQRRSFWIQKRNARVQQGARKIPFSNDTHIELTLSPERPRSLKDHRIGEAIVVAAGAYLSMALESLEATTLRDVTFLQPLTIDAETSLHLVATDSTFRFGTERGGEWITHCTGSYERGAASSEVTLPDFEGEPVDADIDAGLDAGLNLGSSFRWTRSISRRGEEVFCRMEAPPSIEGAAFHPGLIDSCLRTRALGLDGIHVPFHIDTLRVFRKPKGTLLCHSTSGAIRLFDDESLVMEILGFQVRPLARSKELPLYRVEWQRAEGGAVEGVRHVDVFAFDNILDLRDTPNVRLITHGAQAVREGDRVDPTNAWVWGLAKVVAIEQPQLRWSCVDLDPDLSVGEQLSLLQNVPHENQVAFRGGEAYVPRLVPATTGATAGATARVRDDCAYVITGASGALGGHVARWLVRQGARHLILVSRSTPNLDDLGDDVRIVNADVADADSLAPVFDSAVPIKGIIHAAGVLDDALLYDMSRERFARVFAPKVAGTWNLHQRSLGLDLDFFVCFSSAAALIGSAGQANYAAANAYMDALMDHRRALGMPGLSINWSAWAEGGMAGNSAERMTSIGIEMIDPSAGLETLGHLLQYDGAQVGVIPADWSKLLPSMFDAPPPFFSRLIAPKSKTTPAGILPLLENTPRDERRQRLEDHLRQIVVAVAGRNVFDGMSEDANFFELGMDSLMALDLRNRLQTELDRALPSTVALEYPGVRELADYLIAVVLPAELFA